MIRIQCVDMSSGNRVGRFFCLTVVILLVSGFCDLSIASSAKKVIVIGFDGMDPRLSERMMDAGQLPTFEMLRKQGGYSSLATSNPPQSPVAWASFINGAGPGSHGIFDFIHRDPSKQCEPFYSAAQTVAGEGYWEIGDYRIPLNFWPFNHKPSATLLRREGMPFWNYLDQAEIRSQFYNLPANYPPTPSRYGYHSCLSGMGVPDLLGTYGTYQHFAEEGPLGAEKRGGGEHSMIFFEGEKARARLIGPDHSFLEYSKPIMVDFTIYRDPRANAALIEIQEHKILLKEGQWSEWIPLKFDMPLPGMLPNQSISGICRFYLQQVTENFRLYVTPINIDPSDPAMQISEPAQLIGDISEEMGLFYTAGFQEDHKALSNKAFSDAEYLVQARMVLQQRLDMLDYALDHYVDGLLFFYFSSTDLMGHMFWWDSDDKHPTRSADEAKKYFNHIKDVYREADRIVADILKRYGDEATVIVMSDHGFSNFKRQFNINTWLRDNGYIQPSNSTSISHDVDWSKTKAFGLGLNGLYLNLKGREIYGIIEPGAQRESLLEELSEKLLAIRDVDGKKVIRNVYRSDKIYSGEHTELAPDLLIGYYRGYRAAWVATLGHMSESILFDNDTAWSADHCIDPLEVPGVIFTNKPILSQSPSLVDVAPTILSEFGQRIPESMT
ncbi:MAG: alkaline phosphatase family protein, partial [Planctomycetes bacterium]|nr:alkaline phosphatase family protein [Planctomycetota bacterium]